MEDHVPIRPDRSLLIDRNTSKWSLWDVVIHENYSKFIGVSRTLLTWRYQLHSISFYWFSSCNSNL